MKTLIKQYKTPEVNPNLLRNILKNKKQKNRFFVLVQFIIWALILVLFIQNLFILNIEKYSLFSAIGNIGVVFQVIFQVIIGVVDLLIKNFAIIFLLFFISFISNIYSLEKS